MSKNDTHEPQNEPQKLNKKNKKNKKDLEEITR